MATLDRVNDIFADAKSLHAASLERLAAGDIRDASEKAWGATKRATDALILARLGWEPERTSDTSTQLRVLARRDGRATTLVGRYHTRADYLHGHCFYLGICQQAEDVERRIRDTGEYISDAENLASAI